MKMQKKQRQRLMWLVLPTVVILIAMLVVQVQSGSQKPMITTMKIQPTTVTETVVCTGTVRVAEGVDVVASVPCVVGDIMVSVGDRVKEGDVLLRIDRSATLAMAVSAGATEKQALAASTALPETVTAPQAGIVSAVNAVKGETLTTDSPCVVLSEGGEVEIALAVRESILPRLAVGQAVTVTGVAFSRESYEGTLSHIADTARSRVSGTASETVIDAVVTLAASQIDESLLPGLNAKATIVTATRDNAIVVPYEAVVNDAAGDAVYCVQNGFAFRRTVTLGEELIQGVEILDGLQTGEQLVADASALEEDVIAVEVKGAV